MLIIPVDMIIPDRQLIFNLIFKNRFLSYVYAAMLKRAGAQRKESERLVIVTYTTSEQNNKWRGKKSRSDHCQNKIGTKMKKKYDKEEE